MSIKNKIKIENKCEMVFGFRLSIEVKHSKEKLTLDDVEIRKPVIAATIMKGKEFCGQSEFDFQELLKQETKFAENEDLFVKIAVLKTYQLMVQSLESEIDKLNKMIDEVK